MRPPDPDRGSRARRNRRSGESPAEPAREADAHAVEILEAGRIDHFSEAQHFFVNAHARLAGRGAKSASGAIPGQNDLPRRESIGDSEDGAIRAHVGAEGA